jgi:hypothetical protein
MLKKSLLASLVLLCTPLVHADYYSSVDDDGCWDGFSSSGGDCITVDDASWLNSGKFKTRYRNSCSHRVYMRFCNVRENGSEDCGATGVSAGSTTSWSTSNATGEYYYRWVGSERGGMDWVCSGKVNGWKD